MNTTENAAESWPWSVLGIEATGDLVAVKRAYAVKLKQARPDDDPQAYQALRAAYESALAPDQALAPSEPKAAPMPGDQSTSLDDADVRAAMKTVGEFLNHPPTGSDLANAKAGWRALRDALEVLPLQAREDASLAWAQAVSRHFTLSSWLALELASYFGWTSDYRLAEQLGTARLRDLRAWLHEHESRVRDAESFGQMSRSWPKPSASRPGQVVMAPARAPAKRSRWAWLRRVLRR
jgi:hypothetical protein